MKTRFAALVAVSLVGLVVATAATATKGVHVSGTYTVTDLGTTTCVPIGSSAVRLRCQTTGFVSQYTGDLTGSTVTEFTEMIDCRTGRTDGKGVETFTGSIDGVGVGTLTWHDRFRATTDCTTFAPTDFALKAVDFSGTGDLAGLDGKIDFTLTDYDGVLH
jgi:uncharacterized protein DUF3224